VTTQEPAALGDVVSAGLSAIAKPSIMRIPTSPAPAGLFLWPGCAKMQRACRSLSETVGRHPVSGGSWPASLPSPLRRRPLASGVRWWVILLAATPMGRAKSTGRWFVVGGRRVTPLKEALIALADILAKRPAQEILFDWFRSGRLVGELSVLIKRRHPEVQAEIDRVYQEHLATLGKRRRDPAAQDD
jgi:hypothetical protein